MNINAALCLIQCACDQQSTYDEPNSRLILTAVYELADSCVEAIHAMANARDYDHGIDELNQLKRYAEEGLSTGNFNHAFQFLEDALMRATPLPADTIEAP
jgi:hypothetical protein